MEPDRGAMRGTAWGELISIQVSGSLMEEVRASDGTMLFLKARDISAGVVLVFDSRTGST